MRYLPGSPDIANKSKRKALFVHGCFWHYHKGCPRGTVPKRNSAYWEEKLERNRERDRQKTEALSGLGYTTYSWFGNAVLRYGDAETLSLGRARALLDALKQLSVEDPYFRSEDWGPHAAAGLMREELKDDILAIIDAPDHAQLTSFLLEAMVGTPLARQLRPELEAMLFAS